MARTHNNKNVKKSSVDFYTAKNSGTTTVISTDSMEQVYEYLKSPPVGTASLKNLLEQIVADERS